ncbi:hypothetical protein ACWPKO_24970 (plasmid) [Coraliomargarita sp. W4R53]
MNQHARSLANADGQDSDSTAIELELIEEGDEFEEQLATELRNAGVIDNWA